MKFENPDFTEIIENEIKYIADTGHSEWSITSDAKSIKIHFGPFIVFSVEQNSIWMAIDKQYESDMDTYSFWKWDNNDYPEYKQYGLLSKNGYLSGTFENWDKIKSHHFSYLDKISDKKYKLDSRTKKNFDINILYDLAKELNKLLPIPEYIVSDFSENIDNEKELLDYTHINKTDKETIVKNRIGQNIFRENLLRIYNKCCICSLSVPQILKASHIKPWSCSNHSERLDYNNGLLLCANHDALFDRFLISFSPEGKLLISESIKSEKELLDLSGNIKLDFNEKQQKFMEWHREKFFEVNQQK